GLLIVIMIMFGVIFVRTTIIYHNYTP
uniref:Uncharacterized protein n=1 Tax=Amphimedon queenslandica TaxID=400682 RepID=A0A1X7V278_AMPQE